ncbi:MAG: DsrE family protein [Planctomycetes bacterium]|nr:DsrE family protein [Planctomycetota bacterium]
MQKQLTLLLMDPPYESETTTTAFRIISEAQKKGIKVSVFAYEGAVSLTVATQKPHANAPKGCADVKVQNHPTTKAWVEGLLAQGQLEWTYCGLCADERGSEGNMVAGAKRGTPGDFVKAAAASTNVLVIPTR